MWTLALNGAARRPAHPSPATPCLRHLKPTTVQVNLKREKLELSPVYSTALQHDNHKVGYIRLASFSQKAASDMRRHINKLEVLPPHPLPSHLHNHRGW